MDEQIKAAHDLRELWRGEPSCCRGVKDSVCRHGCHRISDVPGWRHVFDLRTGSANPVWSRPL